MAKTSGKEDADAETGGGSTQGAELVSLSEEAAYLPAIDGDVQFDRNGLILQDTLLFDWEEFVDSDTSYFDRGDMTIYKETIQDTSEEATGLTVYGNWWNLFESVGLVGASGILIDADAGVEDDNTTVFDVSVAASETSALEAKYSQTDYGIYDVSRSLLFRGGTLYSITSSIGTAFSSAISEALTTSRPTRFIWNKSHQKPFKKPNETAIGAPTDDE